jgi:hypothetical protein
MPLSEMWQAGRGTMSLMPEQQKRINEIDDIYTSPNASGDKAFLVKCIRVLQEELASALARDKAIEAAATLPATRTWNQPPRRI